MLCVFAEIRYEFIAREVFRKPARNPVVRESGDPAHSVEMESIIPPRPSSSDASILLEDDGVDSLSLERGCGRESRRACPNYDDASFWHAQEMVEDR